MKYIKKLVCLIRGHHWYYGFTSDGLRAYDGYRGCARCKMTQSVL